MADLRSGNPTLNNRVFQREGVSYGDAMTINGTVHKTGFLLLCVVATAAWSWNQFTKSDNPGAIAPLIAVGAIGGFIAALVTVFKKNWSPITAPIYALLEGLVLGGVSSLFEARYPGVAIQAVSLTFGTLFVLLLAYRSGLIRATEKFKMGVVAATGAVALFYFVTFILGFFGVRLTSIYGSGPIGIGFSVVVVIIAALNLVLDFDLIEQGAYSGAPKYMEWYAGFALMVTLIWLYLEILRLLAKLRNNRD
ncbi:MAG TPA: Bax inhibitor-1/YccA family protein [Candidatus Angelobacter sp.]|nr:Bax inhibitor-1/YccA family protein [Candidatus Angelobacter sp.]